MSDQAPKGGRGRDADRTLGALVRNSLGWSFANNFVGRSLTFVSSLVLARLLVPRQFGIFAIALVVYSLLISLNDVGIFATVVRWPGDVDEVAPTATTLIFLTSLLAYGVFFVVAPYCCRFVGAPDATGVTRLLALAIIVDGIFAVPVGMLTRYFRQDLRTVADLVNSAVATVISIVLAIHGFGVWSLAWGRLIGNLVGAILCTWYSRPRYRPGFRLGAARQLLRSGAPLLGTTVVTIGVFNVDYLTIGRVLGPTPLGYYVLAFNVSSWAINIFSFAIDRVTLPTFARLGANPAALRTAFIRGTTFLCLFTFPVCTLMSALNHPLVLFMYGSRWGPSTDALEFLALFAIVRIVQDLAMEALIAVGRSTATMVLQCTWLAVLIPSLALGAHLDGITGVAIGHVLVGFLVVLPLYALAVRRLGVPIGSLLAHLGWPLTGAVVTAVVAKAVAGHFHTPFVSLLVGGLAGLLVYSLAVFPTRHMLKASQGLLEIGHEFPVAAAGVGTVSPPQALDEQLAPPRPGAPLPSPGELLAEVDATPAWFGPPDRPLFGWLHVPEGNTARAGVVLCPPLGIEGRRAHVANRLLATALARQGFLALRFDYDGTGDSPGGDGDPNRVEAWRASIRHAVGLLQEAGAGPMAVVGMRAGATLAVNAGLEAELDALVLWDPCSSGRRYLREQELLFRVIAPTSEPLPGTVELPGQVLPEADAADLAALQLAALPHGLARRLLVLERPGRRLEAAVRSQLAAQGAEWGEAAGQQELLEAVSPHDEPPMLAIGHIAAWLDRVLDGSPRAVHPPPLPRHAVVGRAEGGAAVTEHVARLGPLGLVGVVTESEGGTDGPLVVLLNDGHEHHVGPARLYVELARRWGALGLQTLRLDASGIGDSPLRPGQAERISYAPEMLDDVAGVIAALRPHSPRDVVLMGVCSGAYHAVDYGVALGVRGVGAINPGLFPVPRGRRRSGAPRLPWPVRSLEAVHSRLPHALMLTVAQIFPRRSPAGPFFLLERNGTSSLVVCGDDEARQFQRLVHWQRTCRRLASTGRFRFEHVAGLQHSLLNACERDEAISLATGFVLSLAPAAAPLVAPLPARRDRATVAAGLAPAPRRLQPLSAGSSAGAGLFVICAGTPFDGHRFSERQLADSLSRRAPVLYLDPPISVMGDRGRSLSPDLRQVGQQLWHLRVPTPPGPHRRMLAPLAAKVMQRALRQAIGAVGQEVTAVLLATTMPLFAEAAGLRVLWGTDDLVAGAELMGVSAHRLRAEERKRLEEAHLGLTVSTALAERWGSAGVETKLFPNGVDYDLFSACDDTDAPEDVHLPQPIAGYFGQLSDRIDLRLLEAVAARGHSLLLVGPCQPTFDPRRLEPLLARPNVQWVGGRSTAELCGYLGLIRVGLVPYADTAFNRASFPLKTLEYLAGGRAVASTPLPAIGLLGSDLVICAEGEGPFADAVTGLLEAEERVDLFERRRALARAHSWERRVDQLLELAAGYRGEKVAIGGPSFVTG